MRLFNATGKPIATLCHGPWLLASAGLAQGRTMTSWPGIRDDLVHAGAIWQDEPVVRDGNLVTSRGPQDLLAFVRAIVERLPGRGGQADPDPTGSRLRTAAERRRPRWFCAPMKWLPRPSLRTAAFMAALLALYAISVATGRPRRLPESVSPARFPRASAGRPRRRRSGRAPRETPALGRDGIEQRHAGAQLEVVGRAEDVVRGPASVARTSRVHSRAAPEQRVPPVGRRFGSAAEAVELRRRAAAERASCGNTNHIQWLALRPAPSSRSTAA